jgi:hypothetical protein
MDAVAVREVQVKLTEFLRWAQRNASALFVSSEWEDGEAGGGGGETASHTTPFTWCTPFLKDFSRRHSSPALPFQRLTGKTFD